MENTLNANININFDVIKNKFVLTQYKKELKVEFSYKELEELLKTKMNEVALISLILEKHPPLIKE